MTISRQEKITKSNEEKAARGFGYKGPMSQLEKYKKSDPVFARKMAMYESKIKSRKEKKGTALKLSTGGLTYDELYKNVLGRPVDPGAKAYYEGEGGFGKTLDASEVDLFIQNARNAGEEVRPLNAEKIQELKSRAAKNTQQQTKPTTPTIADVKVDEIGPATTAQTATFEEIKDSDVSKITTPTDVATTTATAPVAQTASTYTADTTKADVDTELADLTGKTGTVGTDAQVTAQTLDATTSAVKNIEAAKLDQATQVQDVAPRTLQADELISGSAVKMAEVESQLDKVKAEQLDLSPEMTIQGQLENLYKDFKPSNPPAWADGAVRKAMSVLNQRGLGASSLAGQAVVQAVMENALPIAQVDAQAAFNLGIQNLSNRQQTVILAAQQRATFLGQEFNQEFQSRVTNAARVSEIANLNFNAEQQVALENARLTQTVNLANLNNKQALVMANAAQTANIETANLNNRQQAAVQNAQAFLQMDLTNLGNLQQAEMFKAQSTVQALFTDAAAENARLQFNASTENQVNQFYDSLSAQVKQFNATQTNAMAQFNQTQSIAVEQFNAQQQNSVDQFNASNGLVVSQANAKWNQQISTIDTAAQNQANLFDASSALGVTMKEYEGMWQQYRDIYQNSWESGESAKERELKYATAILQKNATIEAAKFQMTGGLYEALGALGAVGLKDSNIFASLGGVVEKVVEGVFDIGGSLFDGSGGRTDTGDPESSGYTEGTSQSTAD